ncbi:MAG: hypothetical protein H8D67_07030 [Deltaproteobacteria bacterium]|nr:hypothetical protein [Deltaproteobacteria bacterium]
MLEAVLLAENVGMLCKAPMTRQGGMRDRMETESQSWGGDKLEDYQAGYPKGEVGNGL